jgi:3-hydroxybutyryl-CoA dehydrogenase
VTDAPSAASTDLPMTVGVLGAGTMGAGIAQVAAWAGHPVRLYDIADAPLRRGLDGIAAILRKGAERGKHTTDQAEAAIAKVHGTTRLADLAGCGIVVEAAPEDLAIKQAMFAELAQGIVTDTCILASNTSTLSIASLAKGLAHPERVCGMHFFNPAPLMPLVEVVRGPFTSDDVVGQVAALATAWGKTPVVCADTPGFIVNRVARPFYGEALRLLGDGIADVATIDRLARDAGFPMGPFELMDLIGIDVNFAAAQSVFDGYFGEPRFRPHLIQRQMVESGRLGRKTGQGYYAYGPDGRPLPAENATPPPSVAVMTWPDPASLRVVVVGDGAAMVDNLARRFAAAGVQAIGALADTGDIAPWRDLVESADVGIDVTVADPEIKARTVALLDRTLPPTAPILTCCHARSATEVASVAHHAERVVGFGLLAPIADRRLVECTRAVQTTDAAAAAADALWRLAGLEPVWVGDSTGLVMPRIIACLANEAAFVVQEHVAAPEAIDLAMKLGTRYPRGPLEWASLIGLADVLATLEALAADIDPARYRPAALLRRVAVAGRLDLESR